MKNNVKGDEFVHLEALNYFLIVVSEKSISKAAAKTHISQSALSQMIQKLEEDMGFELLHRSNRGVTLTDAGEIVVKYAINISKNIEKMQDDLKSIDRNRSRVRICGTSSLAAYSLPCMMYKIKKKFANYTFELEAKTVDEIMRDIKEDIIDIGFVDAVVEEYEDLAYVKMGLEKVVLIAKNDYNVKEKISIKDLLKIELIMCTMNKKTCEHIQEALKPLDKKLENLNVIFNADSLTAVKSSVMNGYGMAFVPYESIKHELYEKSIKLIEVEDIELDYEIYMISKKPKDLSMAAKDSRNYLIEIGRKSFC